MKCEGDGVSTEKQCWPREPRGAFDLPSDWGVGVVIVPFQETEAHRA